MVQGIAACCAACAFVRWHDNSSLPHGMTRQSIAKLDAFPSLIAAVSDASHPTWRARSLSVYRFWQHLGYAIGALVAV